MYWPLWVDSAAGLLQQETGTGAWAALKPQLFSLVGVFSSTSACKRVVAWQTPQSCGERQKPEPEWRDAGEQEAVKALTMRRICDLKVMITGRHLGNWEDINWNLLENCRSSSTVMAINGLHPGEPGRHRRLGEMKECNEDVGWRTVERKAGPPQVSLDPLHEKR